MGKFSLYGTLILILFYQNCSPFETSRLSSENASSTVAFSLNCSPTDPRDPLESELKPLNRFELENTLVDLFEPYLSGTQRTQFLSNIRPLIAQIPQNHEDIGMDLANHSVTSIHIERHFLLAESVASFIAGNSTIMNQMLSGCTTAPSTEACRRHFIENFGLRALRRPVDADSVNYYLGVMSGHADSFRNLIAVMIASPLFYYHGEFGADPASSDENQTVSLDAYERASKLSYFFLQSMPDAPLLAAARSGALLTPQGVESQVNRLIQDPKVRGRLTRYFANQWLKLDNTAELRLDIEEVQTYLSELGTPSPHDSLRQNLMEEVYDYFDYLIWEQRATYTQLMTSDLVFPRTQDLAQIYGTSQWNGQYDLTSLVRAPADERSGIITRAQFLYTGSASTRPIMRGVHIYRKFMCQQLNLPPNNNTPQGVVLTDDMTDQEIVRATTEVAGTSCVGCHQSIINPLGFALDHFDALGRFRQSERVFHPEGSQNQGQVLTTKPVNPTTTIDLFPYLNGPVDGAIGLSQQLATNADAMACFSSKLWNFAQKENAEVEANPCAVQSIFQSLQNSNGSILDAIRSIALQPEFLKRKIQ